MTDAESVVRGVAKSLKPGGRFVGEFGGHGNVAAIVTALRSGRQAVDLEVSGVAPWFFPTAEEYTMILESHGFDVTYIALRPRPTPLPTGMEGWIRTFADPFFGDVTPQQKETAIAHAIDLLIPSLRDSNELWTADYVRLRFHAVLKRDSQQ
mmetsp:Transcript_35375/g.40953  ORF Transcript_35375/g.40953 Transcript_35375/m.40953 type:complete len:152 (-) Transcript_35375:34-489(-)